MNRVLVVAASPVIRIVIARTIERIYLKPIPVSPETALNVLADQQPGMMIVDGATRDELLEPLLAEAARRRRVSAERLPRVLLIEEAGGGRDISSFAWLIDARIAKPITPELLQPVMERIVKGS